MDIDAIEHMNADHVETLIDYARYYGNASFDAMDAQLTPNTKQSELEIEYRCRDGSRRTCLVPIPQPVPNLRDTLKEMAHEASIARVPAFQFASPLVAFPLFSLLALLGITTHVPAHELQTWPLAIVLTSNMQAAEFLFGSLTNARAVFYASVIVHVGEATYTFRKLSALMKDGGRGKQRVWAWTLQTFLIGYGCLSVLFAAMAPTGIGNEGVSGKSKSS